MPRRPKSGPLPNAPPRPIVMPAWARPVAARHAGFEELLACASVEWHLVLEGPQAVLFHDLARAAEKEWKRRRKTSDEALLVAYELLRIAPGISEYLDRPEFAWLGTPVAAIEPRKSEFARRVRKKAGAPSRNAYLRAMFDALRSPRSSDGRPTSLSKKGKTRSRYSDRSPTSRSNRRWRRSRQLRSGRRCQKRNALHAMPRRRPGPSVALVRWSLNRTASA